MLSSFSRGWPETVQPDHRVPWGQTWLWRPPLPPHQPPTVHHGPVCPLRTKPHQGHPSHRPVPTRWVERVKILQVLACGAKRTNNQNSWPQLTTKGRWYLSSKTVAKNEPRHDKTNKMSVRQAKTQISLGIHPVWSESSLCAQWVAKDPSFLYVDSEDSDQTGQMPRLIWVFAGRTAILLVLSCRSSNYLSKNTNLINFPSFLVYFIHKEDH